MKDKKNIKIPKKEAPKEKIEEKISDNESTKEYVKSKSKDELYNYAYCGGEEAFNNIISELKDLAEKEAWDSNDDGVPNILKKYILKTFERCKNMDLIVYSEDLNWSCFNTGLLTNNGEDILGIFQKNARENQQPWYLKGFVKESDRLCCEHFVEKPALATYTENPMDYYFDVKKTIVFASDHILDDNFDRYPQEIKSLGKEMLKSLVNDAFIVAQRRIKRNNRLVIPQFYNGKLSYLIPISIRVSDEKVITMALAVEKMPTGIYRANTIFTTSMAYSKARLVMKPESNWLLQKTEKE